MVAQKGVTINGKKKLYDWPILKQEFFIQQVYSDAKTWWEQGLKLGYHSGIARQVKGWAKDREVFQEKATLDANKQAIKKVAKELQVGIEDAMKLEGRLFWALQNKLKNAEDLEKLTLKEIAALQEILYRFMGKPTLITQNTHDVTTKSVFVILQQLNDSGVIKNPYKLDVNKTEVFPVGNGSDKIDGKTNE